MRTARALIRRRQRATRGRRAALAALALLFKPQVSTGTPIAARRQEGREKARFASSRAWAIFADADEARWSDAQSIGRFRPHCIKLFLPRSIKASAHFAAIFALSCLFRQICPRPRTYILADGRAELSAESYTRMAERRAPAPVNYYTFEQAASPPPPVATSATILRRLRGVAQACEYDDFGRADKQSTCRRARREPAFRHHHGVEHTIIDEQWARPCRDTFRQL